MNVWISKIYNFWLKIKFKDSCDKTKPMLIHGFQKTGKCKTDVESKEQQLVQA